MAKPKPPITGGTHVLPFHKLSEDEFERMCLWLVQREGFQSVEHLGAAGSEQGRDITARKKGRLWVFQCKRVQQFGPAVAEKEIKKLPEDGFPEVYAFMVASNVSDKSRKKIRADFPDMEIHFWAKNELDEMVKRHQDIVDEFFQPLGGESKASQELMQDFLEAVERLKVDEADEENLRTIQKVIQSGGVNLGQGNQVSVTAPIIGEINIQFQTAEQAHSFLTQLQEYTPPKKPPIDELPEAQEGLPPGSHIPLLPTHFDIYILCSEYDEVIVEELAIQLEDIGEEIKVGFDKWFVVPGEFHPQQDDVIFKSGKSYAIFLGEHTPIEWFKSNLKAAIETQKSDSSIVILPVLLPFAKELNIDDYPEIRTWIDFRSGIDEYKAFRLLISGIKRVPPGKPPRIKTSVYKNEPTYKSLYLLKKLHDEQIIDKTMREQYTRKFLDNLVGSKE